MRDDDVLFIVVVHWHTGGERGHSCRKHGHVRVLKRSSGFSVSPTFRAIEHRHDLRVQIHNLSECGAFASWKKFRARANSSFFLSCVRMAGVSAMDKK